MKEPAGRIVFLIKEKTSWIEKVVDRILEKDTDFVGGGKKNVDFFDLRFWVLLIGWR